MEAVRLEGVGRIRTTGVADPEVTGSDVLVRVDAAGMCGSDRHILRGEYPSSPPVTLGHEIEGTVVAAGPQARGRTGQRVTVDPNIACGHCSFCHRGQPNHCSSLSAIGVDRDGGLAEFVAVPDTNVHVLSADLSPGVGALCEPLACCLHAADLAELGPGQSVAVLGGGVIGQLLVQLAQLAGATTIVLSTRQPTRRRLAESLGATGSVDPDSEDPVAAVTGPAGPAPGGVDVVFEAAGVRNTFEQSMEIARPGGSVVIVGAAPRELRASIRPYEIFAREVRLQGSFLNPLTHSRAAALLSSGRLSVNPLITRTVGLAEVPQLLEHRPVQGEIKTLAVPGA